MSTINLNVVNQSLNVSAPFLVSDSIDYIEVRGAFSSDWNGTTKWVHFELADDTQEAISYTVIMNNDTISADKHINLSAGTWKVWVHGDIYDTNEDVDRRITTNIKAITVHETGAIDGEVFPKIPPTFAEQVMAIADDAKRLAEDVAEAAERGYFDGAPGEDGYSPAVTITEIAGGHRVTITDETHPTGQTFDVMNGLNNPRWENITNKPFERIGVTLKVEDGTLNINIYETGNPSGGNTLYIGG